MTVPIVPWLPRSLTVRSACGDGPGRVRYGEVADGRPDRSVTVEAAPGAGAALTLTLPPPSTGIARLTLLS